MGRGFGSIIGHNAFRRPRRGPLSLPRAAVDIYAPTSA